MKPEVKKLVVLWSVMWAMGCVLAAVILKNSWDTHAQKKADAAYQQGYKDALYKRPVSDDLEMVCAGLWIGEQTKKYQEMEMKRGH